MAARRKQSTKAKKVRKSLWIQLLISIFIFILLISAVWIAEYLNLVLGAGFWLLCPAVAIDALLGLCGKTDKNRRIWKYRFGLAVFSLSLLVAGLQGLNADSTHIQGWVGYIPARILYVLLGVWGYGVAVLVGGAIFFISLVKPFFPFLIRFIPNFKVIWSVLSGALPDQSNQSKNNDSISKKPLQDLTVQNDSGKIAPDSVAGHEKKSNKPSLDTTSRKDPNPSSVFINNIEISYEVFDEPRFTAPLDPEIVSDIPESTPQPFSLEELMCLQSMVQETVSRLIKLRMEPLDSPLVGMTNIRCSFRKSNGQSVSAKKVLALSEDLGVEIGRAPVRVFIDSSINFEFPLETSERRFVPIKHLLKESRGSDLEDGQIHFLIGRRQDGTIFELPANESLHILVGGATGGGKSVLLHTIIWGLVFRYSPSQVRIALYDHKIEEFAAYAKLPHLWQPVVTNEGGYFRMIDNLKAEINRRKMARRDNPDIEFFWLVVILDEFRGLSNDLFVELIAEARSLQIRFILGTQRAEKSFISPSIKANLPTGISFKVRNQMESRLIIGVPDACYLLPHGDCIVHSPQGLERIQAGWVQKTDLKLLREHLSNI